jgi:tRNA A37 threonylcarbamoyladenosine dehydratase
MEKTFDARTELLLGKENLKILNTKKVAICGNGGVGSIIPIVLARSGILNFVLVDFDKVDVSNLNRQIAYLTKDIGKNKVNVLSDYILNLRKEADTYIVFEKINEDFDFKIFDDCDYIFDCIDDINAKVLLIKYCINHNIKIVSSLGMGNRLDPTKVIITRLNKTTSDPLAKKLRYLLKENGVDISKIMVSFSKERPIIKGRVVASMAFVPNASGLAMASYALKDMLKLKNEEEISDDFN